VSLWSISPVLAYECTLIARRWQTYAARFIFLAALLASLVIAWVIRVPRLSGGRNALAEVGEAFFIALTGTQIIVMLLAAPAYLAGSVCLDKARGTLTHMLVTDLSATEIVLGKLGARGLPVFGLLLAGVPVLALTSLLGGIEPESIAASFSVAIAVGLVSCSLALFLSVWGDKPHEVLLAAYLVEGIWLLALPAWLWLQWGWAIKPPPDWLEWSNPFRLAFAAYAGISATPVDYATFLGGCLGLSVALTLGAALTLRRAARRHTVRNTRRWRWPRAWLIGPSLDFNPVLWREWRRRLSSRWLWSVWAIYALLSITASVIALSAGNGFQGARMAAFVNGFVFSIGLLLVGATTVASLFEERVRGSLDVLLTTPLPTATIVRGKWWAGCRPLAQVAVLPILLACGILVQTPSFDGFGNLVLMAALMIAYGAFVNSLALALATWLRHFAVALGAMVGLYVLLAAGPIMLMLATRSRLLEGFGCVSPWFGIGHSTFLLGGERDDGHVGWKVLWLIFYLGTAFALWARTERTFNRCLGRAGVLAKFALFPENNGAART
jgi:ABC-type transport system involved in multi-copper enzyme maturation permease subunit